MFGAKFAELAQVFRLGAEGFGGVMDECTGGAEGGVFAGDAKAVEVEDAEGVHYGLNPGFGFKMIIREGGAGAVAAEILKALGGGAGVVVPSGAGFFRQQNFARVDAFEGGKEIFGVGFGGEEEFAGGEVEPGGLEVIFAEVKGEEEMVALRFDLAVGEAGPGGDDAGEFAFDEFAGGGRFDLVADRDFDALVEEFLNIIIGGVVGDACHGHSVAVGQGDAKVLGAAFGVLIKDFIEIPKAKQKEGIVREPGTYFVPLLHHGCDFLRLLRGHALNEGTVINDINSNESKANFLLIQQGGVLFVEVYKNECNFI